MNLTLGGKPLADCGEILVQRASAYLGNAPDGRLLGSGEVAASIPCPRSSLFHCVRQLEPFTALLHSRQRVWGNKRTIAELRRRQAQNEKAR